MEIFNFIYYITLFLIPIAPYFIFYKPRINQRFFTNRDWLYLFKLVVATPAIKKYQTKCRRSLDEQTRKELENPKEIKSDIYEDNHFIYGVDQKGNSLSLRFNLRSNLVAEVFLCLRLSNGAIYSFPGEKNTKLSSISSWQWKTKDLQIDVLEPFKRLRLTFNGLLSNANHDVEHVQFNFIWVAAGAPQFHPQDAATGLLADALARHPWRDGNWISLIGDERGYEQFGALKGFVRGDSFPDDLFLTLPSCRTRFWCTTEKLAVERTIHLFVAAQDGAVISLWVKSLRNGCRELQYGNVIMNNGKVYPIKDSDVRLDSLGQHKSLPSTFIVHVNTAKKIYRIVFHLITMKTISTVIPLDHVPPQLSNTPADCDVNTQQAKSLVEFWYRGKTTPSEPLPPPLLLENKTKTLPTCYVTNFDDENTKIVQVAGGKGCSLGLLTSLKSDDFVVPYGFVVTVNAFNKQLEVNFKMKKAVAMLEDICYCRVKGDLEEACAETVKTFQTEVILPEIKDAIVKELSNVKKDVVFSDSWAVRSSAVGEDSDELSAAGQNETFLGCTTPDDVIKSVSSCWASLFTYQSVKYRHQHGLPVSSQMAVVVQKMVPAECAGVLFTCHPSTGNPAHIVITANHGLGESVVSGRSEPDTVILERTIDNDVTIISKTIGSKRKMIRMVEGGVEEVGGIEEFSITDNQALQLGRVGVFLEEKFGGARDIEWGYFQGRLFLLQARPVTTLYSWSNYELSHEFDVATLTEDSVYTIANTGEVLPGAISVLTLSTLVKGLDNAIQMSIESYPDFDNYAFKCLCVFQHHLFIDVIGGIHRYVPKDVSIESKIIDLAIFGHPIINEKIHSLAVQRFGIAGGFRQTKDLFTQIRVAWHNEKNAKTARNLARNIEVGIDKDRDSLKDIYVKLEKSVDVFTKLAFLHCLTTRTSISYQFVAMMVLAENQKEFSIEHYADVAMILASCDDVVSAEIPNILANITKILVENNQAEEFRGVAPEDGQQWLRDYTPEAADIFEKFLEDHGHRGVREFDIYNPTWSTNPSDVIKMIQANCKTTGPKQEKVKTSVNDVISSLVSPKKSMTRRILKPVMKKIRRAVGLREQTKSETIRFVNKIRIGYEFLGEKMALNGLIPDPDLIFHLTHHEIGRIIDGCERSPALIIKAFKRKKLYPKWDELKFPELSYGTPRYETRNFIVRTGSGKIKCQGTPVCAGVIQARACVITDLSEIDQLQDGDVLITYCTDIGWSPYFPMLGGIVTELGGLVSHGAVIAREYGLPCIVGAEGATKLFKTGDTVVLSGKSGTIELV